MLESQDWKVKKLQQEDWLIFLHNLNTFLNQKQIIF